MSGIITDATDLALEDMAEEFEIPMDDLFHNYTGILADPATRSMELNKQETANFALHSLRGECAQGLI